MGLAVPRWIRPAGSKCPRRFVRRGTLPRERICSFGSKATSCAYLRDGPVCGLPKKLFAVTCAPARACRTSSWRIGDEKRSRRMAQAVLDASAVLALLAGEKGGEQVEQLLGSVLISAVNLAE